MIPAGYDKQQFKKYLKSIIGCRPKNLLLYEIAFTHRSASFSTSDGQKVNNERLEFLGDAIIEMILSEYLIKKYPYADEGMLTKIRSRVVSREDLNMLAIKLNFAALLTNTVPINSGSVRNMYGDAFEAFVGALFLDRGYKRTKKVLISRLVERYLDIDNLATNNSDYKSLVHEWSQKNKRQFSFDTREDSFDKERKQLKFISDCYIDNQLCGSGYGFSKKEAEQMAAHKVWIKL